MSAAGRRRPEFSQHFLRSRALASQLIDLTHIAPSELVIEIGPGTGMLTDHLVARGARVRAIEIDPRLASELRERYRGRAEIIEGDFLRTAIPPGTRVVANLPFSITADAVRAITGSAARDAHLVVQREAAIRFAGSPWGPESLASLLLKPWWHVEILRALRPTDFEPPPAVETTLLWLARRDPPLVDPSDASAYRAFIESSVGTGRTLEHALRRSFTAEQRRRLIRDLGLRPDEAPSATSFDRWLALYRASRNLTPRMPSRR